MLYRWTMQNAQPTHGRILLLLLLDHSTRFVHGTAVVGGSNVRAVRSPRLVSNVSCGRVSRDGLQSRRKLVEKARSRNEHTLPENSPSCWQNVHSCYDQLTSSI